MPNGRFVRVALTALATSLCFGLLLTASPATNPAAAQHVCMSDAMRLCPQFIPNRSRITACMIRKRASLTGACRAYFYRGKKSRKRH